MWQALVSTARRLWSELQRGQARWMGPSPDLRPRETPPRSYEPLRRVVLTDGVGHTLFEEYAEHRSQSRGDEETGWLLMGLREADEAVVLATLPAGTERDASATHVRFNSSGQIVGSRIVRQLDKRLTILGLVHTHPGSLRHPSDGDYTGDSEWVGRLRGGEGIFGIGTADGARHGRPLFVEQPREFVQTQGELTFSWYSLRQGSADYHPLAVSMTLGPDLARPLHRVWPIIEAHAEELDRLHRQQIGVQMDVVGDEKPALAVIIPLAEPGQSVRVVIREKHVRYHLVRRNQLLAADIDEERVDRGVYLLLAELAGSA